MVKVLIVGSNGIERTVDFEEWERLGEQLRIFWGEIAKAASELVDEMLEKAITIFDEIHEAATYEKPKIPKPDFTRSRIKHQNFDRKPRFAVRKILQ